MNQVLNATVQRTADHAAPEITLDPLEIVGGRWPWGPELSDQAASPGPGRSSVHQAQQTRRGRSSCLTASFGASQREEQSAQPSGPCMVLEGEGPGQTCFWLAGEVGMGMRPRPCPGAGRHVLGRLGDGRPKGRWRPGECQRGPGRRANVRLASRGTQSL